MILVKPKNFKYSVKALFFTQISKVKKPNLAQTVLMKKRLKESLMFLMLKVKSSNFSWLK